MALAPGTRLGSYEIPSLIGAGGMGEVYRARDPRLDRDVAIKVLPAALSADRDRLHRFEQEARAAAALNHPSILTVHEIGTHEGAPFVVSELLEGQTLREAIGAPLSHATESSASSERTAAGVAARSARHPALPLRKAIDYAIQIANGLAAAHEKGIVHRDVKPENLFVTRDGRVKILDFGLAKLREGDAASGGAGATMLATRSFDTGAGVVLGTAGYMSPEQVRALPVDHRSDIFSFGAVLYEMLAGARAFRGETAADTISAILSNDPPELAVDNAAVSPALDRIVRHCLEKAPEQRFQAARDIVFNLEALSTMATTAAMPATARPRVRRRVYVVAVLDNGGTQRDLSWLDYSFVRGISTDGQMIVFEEEGKAVNGYRTFVRNVDGTPAVEVGSGYGLAISDDKAWTLSLRFIGDARELWLQPVGAGQPRQLSPAGWTVGASAYFFADGKRIVFTARERPDRRPRTYVQTIDGSAPRPVSEEGVTGGPVSQNQKWIAAVSRAGPVLLAVENGAAQPVRGAQPGDLPRGWTTDDQLYVADLSPTSTRIDPEPVDGKRAVWRELRAPGMVGVRPSLPFITPDGRTYVYGCGLGFSDLSVMTGVR